MKGLKKLWQVDFIVALGFGFTLPLIFAAAMLGFAMAASITVIIASQLGLPVSSTHIAVGGILGIGFLREYLKKSYERMVDEILEHHEGAEQNVVETFLKDF